MKESFNYEDHTNEIRRSISVGARCLGVVYSRVVKENEDVYKNAYFEAKRSASNRIQQIRKSLKDL